MGVGGAGAGWVMEPRNTLKGLNSSSLELESEIGYCSMRGFDRINGINRIGRC